MTCGKIKTDKDCNTVVLEEYDSLYAYVYILQLNRTTGQSNQVFIKTKEDEEVIFDLRYDGFYTLITLKVPFSPLKPYYYKDGTFFKNINEVLLEELLEVNPEVSKIDITYDYFFLTCKLRKCYINICYDIFDKEASLNCGRSVNNNSDLIYKRDLIWSALNVINYMVEFDLYEEAERLLERIIGCNGLCEQNDNISNCGCSK